MSKVYNRQKQARKELDSVWEIPNDTLVIHYSCESFVDNTDGKSKRITSIAVRNLKTAQTQSFSIHKYGELKKYNTLQLEEHYDELEKEMLKSFFQFAKNKLNNKWLHWNMRDENYGFHAIDLRYKILGGNPSDSVIPDDKKFDLSRILIGIYGKDYIGHKRLENLMAKNHISSLGFKTGEEEAELFQNKNYVSLHQSTLAKVDILSNISQLAYEGKLKTNASWWQLHCSCISAFAAWLSKNPAVVIIITIFALWQVIELTHNIFTSFINQNITEEHQNED